MLVTEEQKYWWSASVIGPLNPILSFLFTASFMNEDRENEQMKSYSYTEVDRT